MELGELKVFVTVATEHSFSRAAIKLCVTGKVQKFKMREMTVAELTLARVTDVEPT